jgi:cytochrome c biogenesis protein CcmG, thiol:disulfide interchange protein DsbE
VRTGVAAPQDAGAGGEPTPAPGGSRTGGVVAASVILLVTVALAAVLVEAQRPSGALPSDPVGAPAPGFALPTLSGDELALDDLKGQPVVLAFWASWCTTCKADVPKLQRVVDDWGPRGVAVVGVVIEDRRSAAAAAEQEAALRYPSVYDGDGATRDAYGVRGTPETFLLDAEGRVAARWIGPLPEYDLELRLAAVTGQP